MVTTTMGMKRTLAAPRRNIHQANTSHVAKNPSWFRSANVGAIPPMSEVQVMWWLENMRGRSENATSGPPSFIWFSAESILRRGLWQLQASNG